MQFSQKKLLQEIADYMPFNADEALNKERFISFLQTDNLPYQRENLIGHLTASSWIVNKNRTKALLIHHNIYNCWAPLGGHADGEKDLLSVAVKEAQEESGIQNVVPIQKDILDIEVMTVQEHLKKGKTVPTHFHFDIRYLLEANELDSLQIQEHEVSDARWFSVEEIPNLNIDIMTTVKRVITKVHK